MTYMYYQNMVALVGEHTYYLGVFLHIKFY